MMTQFKTLFVVKIAHAYYRENCADVAFIIPADTAQWLKNGKLLARELQGKLYVLFEADEAGAALKTIPGKTLRIGLRLINPFFSNFTKMDPRFTSSKLLYQNAAAPAALDASTQVQLVGHRFSHDLKDNARPVTVTLKDNAGLGLRTEVITAALERSTVSYDLTGLAPGSYTIDEDYPVGLTRDTYYSDPEMVQAGVFGVMEVKIAAGFYGAPPDFEIAFEARKETLKYYVVARNYSENDIDQLSVTDAGFGEDKRPKINFTPKSSDSFTEAEKALLADSSAKVVLFKSIAEIPRSEKPRKKIQLKKNGTLLVTHLPQPRPEDATADLIIPVSKP